MNLIDYALMAIALALVGFGVVAGFALAGVIALFAVTLL